MTPINTTPDVDQLLHEWLMEQNSDLVWICKYPHDLPYPKRVEFNNWLISRLGARKDIDDVASAKLVGSGLKISIPSSVSNDTLIAQIKKLCVAAGINVDEITVLDTIPRHEEILPTSTYLAKEKLNEIGFFKVGNLECEDKIRNELISLVRAYIDKGELPCEAVAYVLRDYCDDKIPSSAVKAWIKYWMLDRVVKNLKAESKTEQPK